VAELLLRPEVRHIWGGENPPEEPLIQWAKQFGDPCKAFVDVGAHIGSWALELAPHFEIVHAFEPQTESFNALCGGISLNAFDQQVIAYNCAVSSENKYALLRIISPDGGGSAIVPLPHNEKCSVEKVACVALDSIDRLGIVGLLKLDCEGSELDALIGARQMIQRDRPRIIFECWLGDWYASQRIALFNYLHKELCYSVQAIEFYPHMFIATPGDQQ
jgi:FkbM family methyltransferase